MTKEIFAPEKCPNCGKTTVVEHYQTGWRVVCPCGYYGVFHFDKDDKKEVSLITLCVDMPEVTKKCLELVKRYTPDVYEQIIVCDRPSTEMADWLNEIAHRDGVKVITNPTPVGVPTALNQGIKVAPG